MKYLQWKSRVEQRINETIGVVYNEFRKGEIESVGKYRYKSSQALKSLLSSINRPNLKLVRADLITDKISYNDNYKQVRNEIKILAQDTDVNSSVLNSIMASTDIEKESIKQELKELGLEIEILKKKSMINASDILFEESFIDKTNTDDSETNELSLKIWTKEGVMTLPVRKSERAIYNASIRISDGNGFPGNTKEVKEEVDGYVYKGQDNLHITPSETIDGRKDTWLEYEGISIDDSEIRKTQGYGLSYQEGLSFLMDKSDSLKLELTISLESLKQVNWIYVSPFIAEQLVGTGYKLTSVSLFDDRGNRVSPFSYTEKINEDRIFIIKTADAKEVVFSFEQSNWYPAAIGHFVYREDSQRNKSYFETQSEQIGRRINGKNPSVVSIGGSYDFSKKKIAYNESKVDDPKLAISTIKKDLFSPSMPNKDDAYSSEVEGLNGRRKMIGIREIDLISNEFLNSGVYVSKQFTSDKEIEEVELEVDIDYEESDESLEVRYMFSPDNGMNWYQIGNKLNRNESLYKKYILNARLPYESRLENVGYVNLNQPVTSIRIRIEMKRLDGSTYNSPVIKGYRVKCLSKGVNLA